MEKRKLILCRGIQASGKSTWAKAWANDPPANGNGASPDAPRARTAGWR